jgi:hypothetical protein
MSCQQHKAATTETFCSWQTDGDVASRYYDELESELQGVQEKQLEREAAKVGLKINEQKTKYMIVAQNDRTIRDVG